MLEGFDPRVLAELSRMTKIMQASLLLGAAFTNVVHFESPPQFRSDDWFASKRARIFADAARDYPGADRPVDVPPLDTVPPEALDVMFDRLKSDYQTAARAEKKEIEIKQGCCNTPQCPLRNWQLCVLYSVLRLVGQESENQN